MKKVEILSDNAVSLNYSSGDSSRCCAFPISSMTDKGEQVVAYRSGQTKHSADGVLLMQTTLDGGAVWSEPGLVYDGTDSHRLDRTG